MSSNITTTAAFLAAHLGALINHTKENGDVVQFTVTKLADKKSGGKNSDNFLMLTDKDGNTKVISPTIVNQIAANEHKEWALAPKVEEGNVANEVKKDDTMTTATASAPVASGDIKLETAAEGQATAGAPATGTTALEVAQHALDVAGQALQVAATASPAAPVAAEGQPADAAPAAAAPAPAAAEAPKAPSKKERAFQIYNAHAAKGEVSRKAVIAEYKAELGMSAEGAATYYQNIKSGKWVEKKADAAAPAAPAAQAAPVVTADTAAAVGSEADTPKAEGEAAAASEQAAE